MTLHFHHPPHPDTPITNAPRLIAAVTALACAASIALAGPITPPPGPVTSAHKTLTEVEPRIAINATSAPGAARACERLEPGFAGRPLACQTGFRVGIFS